MWSHNHIIGAKHLQWLHEGDTHFLIPHSSDKENLDRSDASVSAGFDSPSVKLVSFSLTPAIYMYLALFPGLSSALSNVTST